MPKSDFGAASTKKVLNYSIGVLDCSNRVFDCSIREYRSFDTVYDITQKKFWMSSTPSFQGCSSIPSLPLSSLFTACLKLDSDIMEKYTKISYAWIN